MLAVQLYHLRAAQHRKYPKNQPCRLKPQDIKGARKRRGNGLEAAEHGVAQPALNMAGNHVRHRSSFYPENRGWISLEKLTHPYQRLAIRIRIAGLQADVHRVGDEPALNLVTRWCAS